MKALFTPSQFSFDQLVARLRKGFTQADMRDLALEAFRADRKHRE